MSDHRMGKLVKKWGPSKMRKPRITDKQITKVRLTSGVEIPVEALICPICKRFDLNTTATVLGPNHYEAACSKQHTWEAEVAPRSPVEGETE